MVKNNRLITLCVLTKNQHKKLKKLIKSISFIKNNHDVEILIYDDSEIPNKKKDLQNLTNINLTIKEGKKEGIDKAVINISTLAESKFIWWLGDDEIFPKKLDHVINIIKQHISSNFFWANYKRGEFSGINLSENRYFKDKDEILKLAGLGLGFCSALIMKKKIVTESLKTVRPFIGSYFVTLYICMFVIINSKRLYCISEHIIKNKPASKEDFIENMIDKNGVINNPGFEIFGINSIKIFNHFGHHFEKKTIKKIKRKIFRDAWKGVIVGWIGGWDSPKGKTKLIFNNYKFIPEAYLAIFLLNIPKFIIVLLYNIFMIPKKVSIYVRSK